MTRDSNPVSCTGPCLNNDQPPIKRYQYDTQAHKMYVGGKNLGKGVAFMPQKLGGGVTLLDLETGRTLASLWWVLRWGCFAAVALEHVGWGWLVGFVVRVVVHTREGGPFFTPLMHHHPPTSCRPPPSPPPTTVT